jgi:hypothetical protein
MRTGCRATTILIRVIVIFGFRVLGAAMSILKSIVVTRIMNLMNVMTGVAIEIAANFIVTTIMIEAEILAIISIAAEFGKISKNGLCKEAVIF